MQVLTQWLSSVLATSLLAGLCVGGVLATQSASGTIDEATPRTEDGTGPDAENQEARDSVEDEVRAATDAVKTDRREQVIDEAAEALEATDAALEALRAGDSDAALESLALATGKLDLVVARHPLLALAPIDVRVRTYDLYATKSEIESARKRAVGLLEKGRLQDARLLIEGLRSEIEVEVVNLPLATYPDAIKAIAPLIDEGETEAAARALRTALNTVVVTRHVHPLPVLRAEQMLGRAEGLAENAERTDDQSAELTRLIDGARTELELAEALGYGEKKDFERFYEQLDQITTKTSGGKSGTGFFDKLRRLLSAFGEDTSPGS